MFLCLCTTYVCSHIHYLPTSLLLLLLLLLLPACLHTLRAGSFSCPSSVSLGLMEPDERSGQLRGRGERDRPEAGFNSRESLQALEYLKNVQRIQLRMLCVRVSSLWEKLVMVQYKVTYPDMLGPKGVWIAKMNYKAYCFLFHVYQNMYILGKFRCPRSKILLLLT